jgi:hypothetical protein
MKEDIEGTLNRFGQQPYVDGRSIYYFELVEQPGTLFMVMTLTGPGLFMSKPGDKVKFTIVENGINSWEITHFANVSSGMDVHPENL